VEATNPERVEMVVLAAEETENPAVLAYLGRETTAEPVSIAQPAELVAAAEQEQQEQTAQLRPVALVVQV
jgi:hypothetical protein